MRLVSFVASNGKEVLVSPEAVAAVEQPKLSPGGPYMTDMPHGCLRLRLRDGSAVVIQASMDGVKKTLGVGGE